MDPMTGYTQIEKDRGMSQLVRVQNFFVSMDGFGAREGQSLEAPFGHAERRGGAVARLPADLAPPSLRQPISW
jgi:hypothetical protein